MKHLWIAFFLFTFSSQAEEFFDSLSEEGASEALHSESQPTPLQNSAPQPLFSEELAAEIPTDLLPLQFSRPTLELAPDQQESWNGFIAQIQEFMSGLQAYDDATRLRSAPANGLLTQSFELASSDPALKSLLEESTRLELLRIAAWFQKQKEELDAISETSAFESRLEELQTELSTLRNEAVLRIETRVQGGAGPFYTSERLEEFQRLARRESQSFAYTPLENHPLDGTKVTIGNQSIEAISSVYENGQPSVGRDTRLATRRRSYYLNQLVRNPAGEVTGIEVRPSRNRTSSRSGHLVLPIEAAHHLYQIEIPKVSSQSLNPSRFDAASIASERQELLTESFEEALSAAESGAAAGDAAQTLAGAQAFHRLGREKRQELFELEYEQLMQWYQRIAAIQVRITEEIASRSSTNGIPRYLWGTAQNYLALGAAIISEKHKFDQTTRRVAVEGDDARLADGTVFQASFYTEKQTRIGNFYAPGTNAAEAVASADWLHSGPYSVTRFTAVGESSEVAVELQITGLNTPRSANHPHSNPYRVLILDPLTANFDSLAATLSETLDSRELATFKLNGEEAGPGAWRKPLHEISGVLASHTVEPESIQGENQSIVLKFQAPEDGRYIVLQEAAGLGWSNWVDYDEATILIKAYESIHEELVEPDGFRIIVDGSGTMKGLFSAVVGEQGLKGVFRDLGMLEYLEAGTDLKPVFMFQSAQETALPAKTLYELGRTQATGGSAIAGAVKSLAGNIPDKPWTLLILSDFHNETQHPYFNPEVWATRSFNGKPPLMVSRNGHYEINSSPIPGQGWGRLQEIHLISVQNVTSQRGASPVPWVGNRDFLECKHKICYKKPENTAGFTQALREYLEPIQRTLEASRSR